MFNITRHTKYCHFIIEREGKGALPTELSGMYTDKDLAEKSIKLYIAKFEEEEARKMEADKKHKEALAKPLGHTQRKKPDAKKPSTPRK